MKTLVIYHSGCSDGFGAAWAAWRILGEENVDYRAFYHQYDLPEDLEEFQRVYIVDFSFKADVMNRLCSRVDGEVFLIDHHKTAVEEMNKLSENPPTNLHLTFDMEKSGAVLTWEHFFPEYEVPKLLQYVQDRDLWKWELPDSQEISTVISVTPYEWEDWDNLYEDLETAARLLVVSEGKAMLLFRDALVDRLADKAGFTCLPGWEQYTVPCVNSSVFQSEIGNKLCQDHPFAVIYFVKADGVVCYSLRSDKNRPDEVVDVSEVAQSFGGGGHKHAAGFTTAELPKPVEEDND